MNTKVIRSKKRKKTVAARMEGDTLVLRAPHSLSERQLKGFVEKFKEKYSSQRIKDDGALSERADKLNEKYFEGRLKFESVKFVDNQNRRFGSCSTESGRIRISSRLQTVPLWVLDYVIVHELAHLIEPNHSSRFWSLLKDFPRVERAKGYLQAFERFYNS